MRRQLRHFYNEHYNDDDVSVVGVVNLTDGDTSVDHTKWGNDKTLHLFSLCYGVNICEHHYNQQGGIDYYQFEYPTFLNTIHLQLKNNHYTPLVRILAGGFLSSTLDTTKSIISGLGKAVFAATTTSAIINVVDSRGNTIRQISADIEDKVPIGVNSDLSPTDSIFFNEIKTKLIQSYFYNNKVRTRLIL